ncbi:MAG: hypothetical protein QXL94_07040, partial [Candidatus Parvarchaeum sp.]
TPGSHTPVDVIIIFGRRVYLVQAKSDHQSENEMLKQFDEIVTRVKPDYYYVHPLVLTKDNWQQELDKQLGLKPKKIRGR